MISDGSHSLYVPLHTRVSPVTARQQNLCCRWNSSYGSYLTFEAKHGRPEDCERGYNSLIAYVHRVFGDFLARRPHLEVHLFRPCSLLVMNPIIKQERTTSGPTLSHKMLLLLFIVTPYSYSTSMALIAL